MKTEINTEYGFWGTMANHIDNDADLKQIWDSAVRKILQTKSKADTSYACEFLNSRVGRHLADSLIDVSKETTTAGMVAEIIKLTTYKMAVWHDWFADRPVLKHPCNMRIIYISAIRGAIMGDAAKSKLTAALGDGWASIEHWMIASDEQELARACMDIIK